jgi:ABC-type molybdate transport system substrate-binding protein
MAISKQQKTIISSLITLVSVGLAYAPLPGLEKQVVVVSGTEFKEPLEKIEAIFEQKYPNIKLELKFQGSQDIVNEYIDNKNDFTPTVIIPASGEILNEFRQRWQAQNESEPFYGQPQPIAKTFLVGIAWPERGKVLFPSGKFDWERVRKAMVSRNWGGIGGQNNWGSFDFVMTNPDRSNSGQLTLTLWTKAQAGSLNFSNPQVESLFALVKQSVYNPHRSTDVLLQEFIAKGPNDADVATVYESIALYRWQQSATTQGKPYQIYYLNPTIETIATAAIVRRDVGGGTAQAGQEFINFLRQPEQQKIFVQYGFRPVIGGIDLKSVTNSPWSQKIPGSQVNPPAQTVQPPDARTNTVIFVIARRCNPDTNIGFRLDSTSEAISIRLEVT